MNTQIAKAIAKATAKLSDEAPKQHAVDIAPSKLDESVENNSLEHCCAQARRDKLDVLPINFMASVVTVTTKKDDLWHSPQAKSALSTEINKLVNGGVWDIEAMGRRFAEEIPGASFSEVFYILCIKNSESYVEDIVFKAGIVVQGSNMEDATNDNVFFSDTSSSPTNMVDS
jgi:hypothetical protein